MRLKSVKLAVAFCFLSLFAQPAAAQIAGQDGYNFIKAVRERDGSKAMELLQSRPTVVNARDDKGLTALMVAISARDDAFTSFLLAKGADPGLAARDGDTALIKAARIGYLDAAEQLIARRVRVDAANRMGETALIIAVQQRNLPMVKLLLNAGANPDDSDSAAGLSARDYAKRDARSRDILAAIEAAGKKAPAAPSTPAIDLSKFTDTKIK